MKNADSDSVARRRYQNICCSERSSDSDGVRVQYARIALGEMPLCPRLIAIDPGKGHFTDVHEIYPNS